MKALDRKLLRDLRLMWSQALTIALVVASGIGGFITTLSAVDSLALARDRFYTDNHFADVFASVKRAPNSVAEVLRAVPGVADVQTTVEELVRISIPLDSDGGGGSGSGGKSKSTGDAISGQLIGIDARTGLRLNRISLRSGHAADASLSPGRPLPDGALPCWVSEAFATVHGLKPGARLNALINGKQRTLVVAGVALSPEFIFAGLFGMPDQRGFGIFWVDAEALAAAFDMTGAFNRVALRLAPQADATAVIAAVTNTLQRYGGREVIGRADQTSHTMVNNEIQQQRLLGTLLPSIFLAVAVFLLNVVISRLVATQREQIAALKALGYPNRTIAAHYLKLVLLIAAVGLALGLLLGRVLGGLFIGMYAEVFRFPSLDHHIAPWLIATSVSLTVATTVLGALNTLRATVRLSPAEAMQPPAPGHYRRTLLERLGATNIPTSLRMILRNIERRPWRSGLSVVGVAASLGLVVMGNYLRDAMEVIVDNQFNQAMRLDVTVWTVEPVSDTALAEMRHLPGATAVEPVRLVPVTLVSGHRRERSELRGYPMQPELFRIVDMAGKAHAPTGDGVLLTDRLARKLNLRAGDTVQAEVRQGRPRTLVLRVDGLVAEMMGLNAYMNLPALNRALGEGHLAGGFALTVERGREDELLAATRAMPKVAGAFSKSALIRNMQDVNVRNINIISMVLTVFASVIAVGVVYNNARIALAERTWELASLRVLGFTRAEVSGLLLGEMAILTALALPLGMLMGYGLVEGMASALASDQFAFPVVIRARTFAWAALCVLAAAVASALVVRRRIDRLDMVAALKTRE